MARVSYEYDMDPRYGWVRIGTDLIQETIVVEDKSGMTYGFTYKNGEMTPACICNAYEPSECACPNYSWGEWDDYG